MLSQDHLIVDLMNEPDAYGATWTDGGTLPEDVATYYLDAMDALYPLCPGCLFQIQGCGEPVRLSLPAMGLCDSHTSVGVVRGRHQNALALANDMRCMSKAVLSSAAPRPCKHAPVIADLLD